MIVLNVGKKAISAIRKKWKEMETTGKEDTMAGEFLAGLKDSRLRINAAYRNPSAELSPGSNAGSPEEEYRRRDDLIGDFERRISAEGLSRGRIVKRIVRWTGYGEVTPEEADLGFEYALEISNWSLHGHPDGVLNDIHDRFGRVADERGLRRSRVLGEVKGAIIAPFDACEM